MQSAGMKSRPVDAFRSVISSPNAVGNVLWLTLAALANTIIVGQIGLFGYGTEVLQQRGGHPSNSGVDVDPERIGDYISKGVWPFVVQLVIQIVLSMITTIPIMFIMFASLGVGGAAFGEEGAVLGMFVAFPIVIAISIGMSACTVPFILRAMVTQDFKSAFDFGWARDFLGVMFWEIIFSAFVFSLLAMASLLLGVLVFCVGYIVAAGVVGGAAMHLLSQWYEIYLDRGGKPIPPPPGQIIDATIV